MTPERFRDISTVLTNVNHEMAEWMDKNNIRSYGHNYGYQWVSTDGKFGNKVLSNEELFSLYLKTILQQ